MGAIDIEVNGASHFSSITRESPKFKVSYRWHFITILLSRYAASSESNMTGYPQTSVGGVTVNITDPQVELSANIMHRVEKLGREEIW